MAYLILINGYSGWEPFFPAWKILIRLQQHIFGSSQIIESIGNKKKSTDMAFHGRASNGALPFFMVRVQKIPGHQLGSPASRKVRRKDHLNSWAPWSHGEASRVPVLWSHINTLDEINQVWEVGKHQRCFAPIKWTVCSRTTGHNKMERMVSVLWNDWSV